MKRSQPIPGGDKMKNRMSGGRIKKKTMHGHLPSRKVQMSRRMRKGKMMRLIVLGVPREKRTSAGVMRRRMIKDLKTK